MAISVYEASVPVFVRVMTQLGHILEKGHAHALAKKFDPLVLLQSRLAPDMFPLVRQVQIVSDTAKGGASRLAGQEPPAYEDKEASFGDLVARLDKTTAFLKTLDAARFNGAEDREVTIKIRDKQVTFKGSVYLLNHVLPNLYFHTTTAYAILRHCGVEIGKRDYLGTF